MCIRAATIPRCSGFTTDQSAGSWGTPGMREEMSLMDAFDRFWPAADILSSSENQTDRN
jgi:hypothetical protein